MKSAYTARLKKTKEPAKRRATNLSLDAALVKEAQELDLNISRIVEESLTEAVRAERGRRWVEENKEAFAALNRFHEKHGIFNEDDREW
ncbi:MAG: type II toxin-antitoxin system CcdA family antitoxin [Archangium sp.]